jgi:hypothetical protein
MKSPRHLAIAVITAVVALGAVTRRAAAAAAEPSQQDAKIAQLEAKIAALEAKQASDSQDLANTIDDILRDAERRSANLMQANADMSAGYDSGFFIRSGDNFIMRPGAQFQFRYVANNREDVGGDDSEIEEGFEVRRLKLALEGTVISRELTYKFEWATDRGSGNLVLEDAFGRWMFADMWGTRIGQFKVPVHHEELASSKRFLAVDRSLVNEIVGGGVTDRSQGVSLIYGNYKNDNPLYVEVAFHDGINEDNTNFVEDDFDFGVAGRAEYKLFGDWKAYSDFTAMKNKEALFVVGAGADLSQSGDAEAIHATIDAQYETAGALGLYGALLLQTVEPGGDLDDVTNYGGMVQAGYLLNPSWEVFGRYGIILFDDDQPTADGGGEDTFHELTVGFNYFLGDDGAAGHRAKFTVDLTFLPESSPTIGNSGIGVLGDGDSEIILRGQFQLLI